MRISLVRGKKRTQPKPEQRHSCTVCHQVFTIESPCDYCLLRMYGLSGKAKYDALDHLCSQELYTEELVLKALKQARSGK